MVVLILEALDMIVGHLKNETLMNKQLEHKYQQQKFSILLEQVESLQYALEKLHKKIGLQNISSFEVAVNGVQEFYDTTMEDLLFEARADSSDPANGYSIDTTWLSAVLKDVQAGLED